MSRYIIDTGGSDYSGWIFIFLIIPILFIYLILTILGYSVPELITYFYVVVNWNLIPYLFSVFFFSLSYELDDKKYKTEDKKVQANANRFGIILLICSTIILFIRITNYYEHYFIIFLITILILWSLGKVLFFIAILITNKILRPNSSHIFLSVLSIAFIFFVFFFFVFLYSPSPNITDVSDLENYGFERIEASPNDIYRFKSPADEVTNTQFQIDVDPSVYDVSHNVDLSYGYDDPFTVIVTKTHNKKMSQFGLEFVGSGYGPNSLSCVSSYHDTQVPYNSDSSTVYCEGFTKKIYREFSAAGYKEQFDAANQVSIANTSYSLTDSYEEFLSYSNHDFSTISV